MADDTTIERAGWLGMSRRAITRSASRAAGDAGGGREVEIAFARCFSGDHGTRVLDHLHAITLDRALGPDADDAALRHLEGQRALVLHLRTLIERGRAPR